MMVWKLVRAELKQMFCMPIAWLLLAVFIVQVSIAYSGSVLAVIKSQSSGTATFSSASSSIFAFKWGGVFSTVQNSLVFYMPLITMNSISREFQTGTIFQKLSSPILTAEIVIAKYTATFLYSVMFVAFLVILAFATNAFVPNFDVGLIVAGLCGILLLIAAYGAIGIFLSSLTAHPVVAAAATIALLGALQLVGALGQEIPGLSDFATWLSIAGRVDNFRDGIVSTADVSYFAICSVVFVFLAHERLESTVRGRSRSTIALRTLSVLLIASAIGAASSNRSFSWYFDLTQQKSQTPTQKTLEVMAALPEPVRIDVFVNILDESASLFLPDRRRLTSERLFDRYNRHAPGLKVAFHYYYGPSANKYLFDQFPGQPVAEVARRFAANRELSFSDVAPPSRVRFGQLEGFRNFYLLSAGSKRVILRNFDDFQYLPSEPEFADAFRLLTDTPVRIGYVTGHGERSAFRKGSGDHYTFASSGSFRSSLINHGYEILTIGHASELKNADLDVLVLAAPKYPMGSDWLKGIREFIDSGRNMLALTDVEENGAGFTIGDHWLLENFGVRTSGPTISRNKMGFPQTLIFGEVHHGAVGPKFEFTRQNRSRPLIFAGATELVPSNGERAFASDVILRTGEGKTIGLALSREIRGRSQRIALIGDSDFLSNGEVERQNPATNNVEFASQMFRWLSNDRYPLDVKRSPALDNSINISLKGARQLGWGLSIVVPLMVVLYGTIFLILRRRR